jgi:hypothetical protein
MRPRSSRLHNVHNVPGVVPSRARIWGKCPRTLCTLCKGQETTSLVCTAQRAQANPHRRLKTIPLRNYTGNVVHVVQAAAPPRIMPRALPPRPLGSYRPLAVPRGQAGKPGKPLAGTSRAAKPGKLGTRSGGNRLRRIAIRFHTRSARNEVWPSLSTSGERASRRSSAGLGRRGATRHAASRSTSLQRPPGAPLAARAGGTPVERTKSRFSPFRGTVWTQRQRKHAHGNDIRGRSHDNASCVREVKHDA